MARLFSVPPSVPNLQQREMRTKFFSVPPLDIHSILPESFGSDLHISPNLEDWWPRIEVEEGVAAVGNTRRRRRRPCHAAKAKIVKGVRGDRSTVPFTCHPGNPTPPSSSSSSSSSSNPPFSNPPPFFHPALLEIGDGFWNIIPSRLPCR